MNRTLSPPQEENVPVKDFEKAIARIERKLGLDNQPRAIVFHEKEGRRHAHVVWSRIDVQEMKAINLPHYKLKLRDISRELYLEHGWKMPQGLTDSRLRDPANFSLSEWQQAKRAGRDAKELIPRRMNIDPFHRGNQPRQGGAACAVVLVPQASCNAADGAGCPARRVGHSGPSDRRTVLARYAVSSGVLCACHMSRYDPMKWVNIYVPWY